MWKPFPGAQERFCRRGDFEVLFGGSAGPGKTDCIVAEAARFVHMPAYRAVLFRRTFPQLQEIIDRCFKLYPTIWGMWVATDKRWYFPSGSFVALSHLQHENDKYNHQGKEYHFAGFDELTQFTETQYLYLHSRVRTTDPNIPKRIRASTNPGGIGHKWVKERFIDPMPPTKSYIDPDTGKSRCYIPATIEDNPALFENDPDYVIQLEALPEIEKLRLRYGIWDAFEGQVFSELSQRVHGCEPFEIPPEWTKFMVFDWGFSKPFSVGWYAVDYDGVIYRYREWYGCEEGEADKGLRMTNDQIAQGIFDREKERIDERVADPAIWSRTPSKMKGGIQGPSVFEDLSQHGLFFLKADNDRIQGKLQVHKRLELEHEIDNDTGEVIAQTPRVQIFNDQKHFWRTVPEMRQDENNPEDVDTDQEDHIYDEFRYACMYRPIIVKQKDKAPAGSFVAERNRLVKAKKYARRHGVSLTVAYQRVR